MSKNRFKMIWDEQISQYLLDLDFSEDMVQDRSSWKNKIKVNEVYVIYRDTLEYI